MLYCCPFILSVSLIWDYAKYTNDMTKVNFTEEFGSPSSRIGILCGAPWATITKNKTVIITVLLDNPSVSGSHKCENKWKPNKTKVELQTKEIESQLTRGFYHVKTYAC